MEELKEKIAKSFQDWHTTILATDRRALAYADVILVLFQAYLKEHNLVELDEDQSLPENPYRTDYEELPNEFQDEATGEDVYLMAHNGVERGMRNMLKAGFKKVRSD